jgi:hypothetical protein
MNSVRPFGCYEDAFILAAITWCALGREAVKG